MSGWGPSLAAQVKGARRGAGARLESAAAVGGGTLVPALHRAGALAAGRGGRRPALYGRTGPGAGEGRGRGGPLGWDPLLPGRVGAAGAGAWEAEKEA